MIYLVRSAARDIYHVLAVAERRAEIEPRGAGNLVGIRGLMDLSLDLNRADEPLGGGPDDQVHAAKRGLGVDFDAGVFARAIEPFDYGADLGKMERRAWGKRECASEVGGG